jgi:predicted PurR-regulated permease PerM
MSTTSHGRTERLIRGIAAALLLIGCLVVLWPFLSAILWAIVLTFTTWPIYSRLLARLGGRRTLAALVMMIATLLILVGPFVIVGFSIADDVSNLTAAVRHWMDAGLPDPPAWVRRIPLVGSSLASYWSALAGDTRRLLGELKQFVEPAGKLLLTWGLVLAGGALELTLSILVAFFLYRDGAWLAGRANLGAQRIAGEHGSRLLDLAGRTVRAVVYGILGTALVQGVLAGIGYLVVRVPGAIVLAMLTFFLSVLPFGPPLIWIPVTIWLFYKVSIGWGIFMLIWGILISSTDNVVKPWLISQGSDLPFILIFFGVIGGAMTFGLVGVFLGPTLLAVGYRVLQEWLKTTPVEPEVLA